ncbi:MAG TPA: ArdC family protein [Phycisphaerae bacterium]|nr:ArdC family protein [Phycisphaerae bacterium]HRY70707.1 ArdC family protein [Phycisphaerae bacterium]HSA28698.1 ArdC family protein [Phycisphaerae bacterium]
MKTRRTSQASVSAGTRAGSRRFLVYNVTDAILAHPELLMLAEARAFIRRFPDRFAVQGHYLTASGERISPEGVELDISGRGRDPAAPTRFGGPAGLPGVVKTNASQTQQIIRRAVDELVAALEAGQSDRLKAYLAMLARFPRYSWGNVLLIHWACPQASHVAGYRAWQRLGRQVRRGARGIRILAPVVVRDPNLPERERVVAFRTAVVFDISMTDGRPLPEFARPSGDPGIHLTRLEGFVREQGIALEHSDRLGGAEGMSVGGRIVLRAGLEPAEEFAVLAHEAAHELLHSDARNRPASRTVRETEAEAVAFVVCQAVGLDANGAASDYIQLYQGNRETLLASLERVQRTAATIIRGVLGPDRSGGRETGEAIEPLPVDVKRLAA